MLIWGIITICSGRSSRIYVVFINHICIWMLIVNQKIIDFLCSSSLLMTTLLTCAMRWRGCRALLTAPCNWRRTIITTWHTVLLLCGWNRGCCHLSSCCFIFAAFNFSYCGVKGGARGRLLLMLSALILLRLWDGDVLVFQYLGWQVSGLQRFTTTAWLLLLATHLNFLGSFF